MTQQTGPDFGDIKIVRTGNTRTLPSPAAANGAAVGTSATSAIVPTAIPTSGFAPDPVAAKKPWLARYWWLPLLLMLGLAATLWGRNYYTARYVGTDYWAQVPATQNTTPVERMDMNGEPTGVYGVEYMVTAFNEAGDQRELEFVWIGDNAADMPQPGQFLQLSASQTLVVGQQVVSQNAVPTNVQQLIAGQ